MDRCGDITCCCYCRQIPSQQQATVKNNETKMPPILFCRWELFHPKRQITIKRPESGFSRHRYVGDSHPQGRFFVNNRPFLVFARCFALSPTARISSASMIDARSPARGGGLREYPIHPSIVGVVDAPHSCSGAVLSVNVDGGFIFLLVVLPKFRRNRVHSASTSVPDSFTLYLCFWFPEDERLAHTGT
jgi:hypothetical protein